MPKTHISISSARRIQASLSYLFLITVGVTMIFPLLWMLLTSLKSPGADVMNLSNLFPTMSYRLAFSDVRDWDAFTDKLASGEGPAAIVWQSLAPEYRERVLTVSRRGEANEGEKREIVAGLNNILLTAHLWTQIPAEQWLDEEESDLVATALPTEMTPDQRRRINRVIFDELFTGSLLAARRFHWDNYRTVFIETKFLRAFFNSALVTLFITFGQVFTSSLAAFAFARLKFFARDKIFMAYLGTMMVPGAVTMIPVFILLRQLGWIDTYKALIIPAMFSAYGTFMLRQFFMNIPNALEEAAILDGCTAFGVYRHVILPLSKPALTALGIITFMGAWRSFMWPLIVTHSQDLYTLPVALSGFQEMYGVQWTLLMAGSVIMIIPMLLVFIIGQRFFVEGIQLGAVKG